MALSLRHRKIITSVLEHSPEAWFGAGRDAVLKEQEDDPQSSAFLAKQLIKAMEEACERQMHIAMILKSEPKLEPEEYPVLFEIFRCKRLAHLFVDHHEMAGILKTRAESTSYNVGVKSLLKIYSEVAEHPMLILRGCEILCQLDDIYGFVEEGVPGAMRETLEVMEYLVEHDSKHILKLYPEYKTIPTKADWDGVEEERQTRKRKTISYDEDSSASSLHGRLSIRMRFK